MEASPEPLNQYHIIHIAGGLDLDPFKSRDSLILRKGMFTWDHVSRNPNHNLIVKTEKDMKNSEIEA